MASRTYDIILSCNCMISLDGGGGLIDCMSKKCKFEEEYLKNPKYKEWQKELRERNK